MRKRNDFLTIPKDLFRLPQYSHLSAEAKLLYGFLLDRSSLSKSKGTAWQDKSGSYFVYFPISEIMERLGCGHDKAAALLKSLEDAHLISRTRIGLGKPYRIVVRSLCITNYSNSEIADSDLWFPERNKTDAINTDINHTESSHTDLRNGDQKSGLTQIIKMQIYYDSLLAHYPQDLLDCIVSVIVDALCTSSAAIRISGEMISKEEIKRYFFSLDEMDIAYVCDVIETDPHDIRYLRKYILARLLEAKQFRDLFYSRWQQRDG